MKRSRTLAAILVSVLTLLSTVASAGFVDGYQLKTWSEATNRVQNGGDSPSDVHEEAYFIGYVSGVSDVADGAVFCSPPNAKLGQLMGVVSKYLLANPEKWNQSAALLAVEALRQAFPCQ